MGCAIKDRPGCNTILHTTTFIVKCWMRTRLLFLLSLAVCGFRSRLGIQIQSIVWAGLGLSIARKQVNQATSQTNSLILKFWHSCVTVQPANFHHFRDEVGQKKNCQNLPEEPPPLLILSCLVTLGLFFLKYLHQLFTPPVY